MWRHTFEDRLGIDPTECKILLTDPPLNPKKNRERMVSTMFETWGFQAGAYIRPHDHIPTQPEPVLVIVARATVHFQARPEPCL